MPVSNQFFSFVTYLLIFGLLKVSYFRNNKKVGFPVQSFRGVIVRINFARVMQKRSNE